MKGFSVKSFRKTALMLRLYESMKYNLNSTNISIKLVHRHIVLLEQRNRGKSRDYVIRLKITELVFLDFHVIFKRDGFSWAGVFYALA